jgi:aspartate/methionine/tyrosine aminotransferase
VKTARRLDHIEPFYVMECAKAAADLARGPECIGSPMVFLNIGEPDFTAPPLVQEAAERAVRGGHTQYTDATGLPDLRERISGWYHSRFGLQVSPRRIVVTAGASAALQLACLALVDRDDEVLLPDPSYACNRHFVAAAEGRPVLGAHDRCLACLALQPHRHVDRSRRDGAHRAERARARRFHRGR